MGGNKDIQIKIFDKKCLKGTLVNREWNPFNALFSFLKYGFIIEEF